MPTLYVPDDLHGRSGALSVFAYGFQDTRWVDVTINGYIFPILSRGINLLMIINEEFYALGARESGESSWHGGYICHTLHFERIFRSHNRHNTSKHRNRRLMGELEASSRG